MPRTWSLILILFLILSPIFAQEEAWDEPEEKEEEETPALPTIESEWFQYEATLYTRGDRTFSFTLGVVFPTYFSGIEDGDIGMRTLGGSGSLGFTYFLTSNIFVGGELTGMFSFTRRGNSLFIIPFGASVGYQFVYRRLEIPVSLMVGGAPQLYLETNYFGPIFKPGVSLFWRMNADWSFGLNTLWWIIPQRSRGRDRELGAPDRVIGNFLELTLSARYHF